MLSRNSVDSGMKAQLKECTTFGGAVFLCSRLTRKECFDKKIFGLPHFCADFVEKVKVGTTLFLYDVDQCKLHGVFEAASDGAVNIIPDAYVTSGKGYPSQIRFKRIWFCKPLMLSEFQDAVQNYCIKNKFSYGLSHQQVAKLLHLFSSQNRLQLPQNPRLQDLPRDLETSSLDKVIDMQSSPDSSSCGSFRSTCQTCSSTTLGEHTTSLGEKLIDPMALVHRGLQSDTSDVAKSKSSKYPLQSGADMATVTVPGNQEAIDDQSTDDYIPLPQEDTFEGVDLFALLKDESHSSESKGSSDSENLTTFHQVSIRKEDECYPPILDSKLRSDSEGRTSVFSRLVRKHEMYNHRKRFKTEAFSPRSAEFSNALSQRKKQRRAQHNRPFPCPNDGMLDMPSADRSNRAPASNCSFVWRRSTKSSGGEQSGILTGLGPFLFQDGNKRVVSSKQPARYNTCKRSFVPQGCPKVSCDKGLNVPAVFSVVHDCNEVNVKEMRSPFLNCKQPAKVVCSEDVKGEGRKKRRATASFHQEYPSDTALIPKGTKTMDMLAVPDENFKEKSSTLSSKDTHTELSVPYLDAKVLLQDEQQQSFQGSFGYGEDATCDSSLILEGSKTMEPLSEQSFGVGKSLLSDETQSHVAADYLGMVTSSEQKETQSIRSCHRVDVDRTLLLGKSETMDLVPGHDEDCEHKKILPSDKSYGLATSCYLETEMPLLQKQTPNVLSCSEVVHDDEVLIPEIPESTSPKFYVDCAIQVTNLCSGYREEVCHVVNNYHEVIPSDAAPDHEGCGPLNNFPPLHGDSAKKNFLCDKTSEYVSTGHQDTVMPPCDKHQHSCCGDTSSVMECTIVDTGSGDGGSEHKNSSDEKDDETLYFVTGSKDTFSCDGIRSCAPTNDQVCSEVMLLKEEGQYQNLQSNSNSVDSFAVSSEGSGSKSGISVPQVADLLGTNAESRTSFVNAFSNESAETFSAPALGGEDADHNVSRSEAYAEPPILQHDPGDSMEQL